MGIRNENYRLVISPDEVHRYYIENAAGLPIGVFRQGCQQEAEFFVQAANSHHRAMEKNRKLLTLLEEASIWIKRREPEEDNQPVFLDHIEEMLAEDNPWYELEKGVIIHIGDAARDTLATPHEEAEDE